MLEPNYIHCIQATDLPKATFRVEPIATALSAPPTLKVREAASRAIVGPRVGDLTDVRQSFIVATYIFHMSDAHPTDVSPTRG
ncbi:MAG: hypothetical protein AAGF36_09845, partial [Pseudomonadota bacterium]